MKMLVPGDIALLCFTHIIPERCDNNGYQWMMATRSVESCEKKLTSLGFKYGGYRVLLQQDGLHGNSMDDLVRGKWPVDIVDLPTRDGEFPYIFFP